MTVPSSTQVSEPSNTVSSKSSSKSKKEDGPAHPTKLGKSDIIRMYFDILVVMKVIIHEKTNESIHLTHS